MKEMEKVNIAVKHRPFNPASAAHRQFLSSYFNKVRALQDQYPYLNFTEELKQFGGS